MNLPDYPGLLPGVALAVILGFALRIRVARVLGTSRLVAWGLVAGIGLVIAATLTPGAEAIVDGTSGSGRCDLSRMTLAPLREILELDETGMNVLLFAPLGLALGLLPRSRGKALLILAAIALPFVVEGIQLVVTPLGRQCQSADVIDNLTGLVVGLLGGIVIGAIFPGAAAADRRDQA